MTRKHIVSLVAASLILAGTAFAQQSPQEPQAQTGGQPGSMMRPGMMAHGAGLRGWAWAGIMG